MKAYNTDKFAERVFLHHSTDSFNELAVEIFLFQYANNDIYNRYCSGIGRSPANVRWTEDIPFLPIELYRQFKVTSVNRKEKLVFHSSGTTAKNISSHYIYDPKLYTDSVLHSFQYFYGNPDDYCFFMLCPSLEEKPDSSLAFMSQVLINASESREGGFFLNQYDELMKAVKQVEDRKIFILGLSFALLDWAESKPRLPENIIVAETGGMKGRRKEIPKNELYARIKKGLHIKHLHSEYSMCELLSQAYAGEDELLTCPPWMKVKTRNLMDPLEINEYGKSGGINIIDLANFHSCAFIATQDSGKVFNDERFEITGRLHDASLKGCVLLADE